MDFRFILHFSTFCYIFNEVHLVIANLIEVKAMVGSGTRLPCNLSTNVPQDSVRLVLWYKENIKGGPIYSLDARHGPFNMAKRFSSVESLASRVFFDVSTTNPSYLVIEPTFVQDDGEYKCRVDFRRSRTVTNYVRLKIIVPPKKLLIADSAGQVLEGKSPPLDEGSDVALSCQAFGGVPSPNLKWFHKGKEIDGDFYIDEDNVTAINDLLLTKITRDYFETVLVCQAQHSYYQSIINISLLVDMNLRPLSVLIEKPKKSLIAGNRVDIVCTSTGSRPPAILIWSKSSRKLTDFRETIVDNGNRTKSVLSLLPSREDDGTYLVCRAENIRLSTALLEDKMLLNVNYKPIISLRIATPDKQGLVKILDRVWFECKIEAKPNPVEITWYYNGHSLTQPLPTGIEINKTFLFINSVHKEHKGFFQCSAQNMVGKGESNILELNISYSPMCKLNQKFVYGIGVKETARILCDVDAYPTAVNFFWTINDTSLRIDKKFPTNSEGLRSSLLYTPQSRFDYGLIRCWSENAAGKQSKPCLFSLVPAGIPNAPEDCLVSEMPDVRFRVDCSPGYDGGLQQSFHLEVYSTDIKPEYLLLNLTNSDIPSFIVKDIPHEISLLVFKIYSANIKGRCRLPIVLKKKPSSAVKSSDFGGLNKYKVTRWRILMAGTSLALLLLLLLYIIVKRKAKLERKRPKSWIQRVREEDETKGTQQDNRSQANKEIPFIGNASPNSPDIIPHCRNSEAPYMNREHDVAGPNSMRGLEGKHCPNVVLVEGGRVKGLTLIDQFSTSPTEHHEDQVHFLYPNTPSQRPHPSAADFEIDHYTDLNTFPAQLIQDQDYIRLQMNGVSATRV